MLSQKLDNLINIAYFFKLKNALSILLLFAWTLFHYSRIQSYLQCPITPVLSSTSVARCDCEKQAVGNPADNSGSSGTDKSVPKPRPDDTFAGGIPFTPGGHYAVSLLDGPAFLLSSTPAGFAAPVFQPPRG